MGNHTGHPSPETEHEILAAYASGEYLKHIAQRLGVSYYHAQRCVNRHGLPRLTRAEVNTLRRPHVDAADLRRLLDQAVLRHHEIAAHFGVSVPTLTRTMRSLGYRSVRGRGSRGEDNYFWRGGRSLDVDGYVLVKKPDHPYANNNGYVREHRLVMESVLGRHLLPNEVVHHRDGDKANNSPTNLAVYQSNAQHLRDELTGRTPNYSQDGLRRMRENALRVNRRRALANQRASGTDAGE